MIAKLLSELKRLDNAETPTLISILVLEDLTMALYLPLVAVLLIGLGFGAAAVSAAGVLVVAGCTSSDGGGSATPGGTPAGGGGATEDLSGVTLDVSAAWSGDEQANFEQVLAQFESDTGATVIFGAPSCQIGGSMMRRGTHGRALALR